MTLQEWADKYDEEIQHVMMFGAAGTYKSYYVYPPTNDARRDIFTLTDFKVSSVCGPVYWVRPVKKE